MSFRKNNPFGWGECDREKDEDGRTYYGYDDEDGKTMWYDEDGSCDCYTDTPDDEDEDW